MATNRIATEFGPHGLRRGLAARTRPRAARWTDRVVINAPIDEVLGAVTSRMRSNGQQVRVHADHGDPTYGCSAGVKGRCLDVRYTFYPIPGGTQVDTTIECRSNPLAGARAGSAIRAERRTVADALTEAKQRLE